VEAEALKEEQDRPERGVDGLWRDVGKVRVGRLEVVTQSLRREVYGERIDAKTLSTYTREAFEAVDVRCVSIPRVRTVDSIVLADKFETPFKPQNNLPRLPRVSQ